MSSPRSQEIGRAKTSIPKRGVFRSATSSLRGEPTSTCKNGTGLNRIQAFVFPDNAASAKVLLKCGFCFEGRLRDYFRDERGFHDLKVFAVLAKDYSAS